jgi:hypothetical protein
MRAPQVYNNLHAIAERRPVHGNKEGSFLTMWSMEGLVFGIINIIGGGAVLACVRQLPCHDECVLAHTCLAHTCVTCPPPVHRAGNFGTVFVDQAYW